MILFYDIAIHLIALFYFPIAVYRRLRYGKYKENLFIRFGFKSQKLKQPKKRVVWIHACSLGETKAASTLALYYKDTHLIISNLTETGHAAAKELIPYASDHIFLPLDFSWAIRRLFKQVRPDLLILIESDFWLNFLMLANCHTVLASGVLSKRSHERFKRLPAFTKKLFSPIDQFLVQNATYQERFADLGITATIGGNLKYDLPAPRANPQDFLITIGSTHDGEEELLLDQLEPLMQTYPNLKIQIVPRHPERFQAVKKHLTDRPVTVITEMGVLLKCYAQSKLAIVGGSFVPKIGGHNILEPIQCGIPVFHGPYMAAQQDLVEIAAPAGGGFSLEAIEKCLADPEYYQQLVDCACKIREQLAGAAPLTHRLIEERL